MAANEKFAELSSEEIDNLITDSTPKSTKRATAWGVSIFRDWLSKRYPEESLDTLTPDILSKLLRRFYQELRKSPAEHYSPSAHLCIRAALERYYSEVREFNDEGISIIRDPLFRAANKSFTAKLKLLKAEGLDKVQHHPSITQQDLQKCYDTKIFGDETPLSLLRVNWFNICLYFCRKGRGRQRALTKESFVIKKESNGLEYVKKVVDQHEKDLRDTDEESADEEEVKMFATGGKHCPVRYFKLFLSALNPFQSALFQNPKKSLLVRELFWFENSPIGVNRLAVMMKNISTDARLSRIYTNHCVRTTPLSVMDAMRSPQLSTPTTKVEDQLSSDSLNLRLAFDDQNSPINDEKQEQQENQQSSQIQINIVANVAHSATLDLFQNAEFKDCKITFNVIRR